MTRARASCEVATLRGDQHRITSRSAVQGRYAQDNQQQRSSRHISTQCPAASRTHEARAKWKTQHRSRHVHGLAGIPQTNPPDLACVSASSRLPQHTSPTPSTSSPSSRRGRAASLPIGPADPYRISMFVPSLRARQTNAARAALPVDARAGASRRISMCPRKGLVSEDSNCCSFMANDPRSGLSVSKSRPPTRSRDCMLGLGSFRWLNPDLFSCHSRSSGWAAVFATPMPCISLLRWGKAVI
jgi:hypothetical protein